jgi:hypothetical protein
MTLFHHSTQSYETAAKAARDHAEAKLQRMINQGKYKAWLVIKDIFCKVPLDRLTAAQDLEFYPVQNGVEVGMPQHKASLRGVDAWQEPLHNHALNQLAQRGGIPKSYVDRLVEKGTWGTELLAKNLRELYGHDDSVYLTRSMDGEVRGFLSDRFKRIDCRPTVERFITVSKALDAVPIEGYQMQTRVAVKVMLPKLFEPVPNEIMGFGISLLNSDYGAGAFAVKPFCLRLWCTNYAIMEDTIRAVHLGQQLKKEDLHLFSQQTLTLQGKAMESAVEDVVKGALSAERINQYCEIVRQATSDRIDFKGELDKLRKKGLLKGEADQVRDVYLNGGIEQLPPGENMWRMSNALSWLANETQDTGRKVELMEMAGSMLPSLPSST